jgi:soluble P-type ATPase
MEYIIPQVGKIVINTLVLDLNGTLSVHGKIVEGVKERIFRLKDLGFTILLYTGDQRGNVSEICNELGIEFKKAISKEDKELFFFRK